MRSILKFGLCGALAFVPACVAEVTTRPVGVAYVEATPSVEIETYPHVVYEGVNVYYVEGRWYRRGARGWVYYREEPPALARQRVHVQSAPRVHGHRR